jgi:hypothetical protein
MRGMDVEEEMVEDDSLRMRWVLEVNSYIRWVGRDAGQNLKCTTGELIWQAGGSARQAKHRGRIIEEELIQLGTKQGNVASSRQVDVGQTNFLIGILTNPIREVCWDNVRFLKIETIDLKLDCHAE